GELRRHCQSVARLPSHVNIARPRVTAAARLLFPAALSAGALFRRTAAFSMLQLGIHARIRPACSIPGPPLLAPKRNRDPVWLPVGQLVRGRLWALAGSAVPAT